MDILFSCRLEATPPGRHKAATLRVRVQPSGVGRLLLALALIIAIVARLDHAAEDTPAGTDRLRNRAKPSGSIEMNYVCLVYGEENHLRALSKEGLADLDRRSVAYDKSIEKAGKLVIAQALQSVKTSKTVRKRKGKVMTTDGPFAGDQGTAPRLRHAGGRKPGTKP